MSPFPSCFYYAQHKKRFLRTLINPVLILEKKVESCPDPIVKSWNKQQRITKYSTVSHACVSLMFEKGDKYIYMT